MATGLAEQLERGRDFYLPIGTASATLVGVMFIAVSIGVGLLTEKSRLGRRAFITPIVAHFSAVLTGCVILVAPLQGRASIGVLLLLLGAAGLGYACWVFINMGQLARTTKVDLDDRIWYAIAPVIGHAVLIAAAIGPLAQMGWALDLLALGLALLLMISIRNAWDITIWIVMSPRNS